MGSEQMLKEILRLTEENNRILRASRRNALIGGIFKFIVYIGLIVALPAWLYVTYLAPVIESAMQTVNQIQGTSAQAQAQFQDLQNLMQQFDLSQYLGR